MEMLTEWKQHKSIPLSQEESLRMRWLVDQSAAAAESKRVPEPWSGNMRNLWIKIVAAGHLSGGYPLGNLEGKLDDIDAGGCV